MRRLLPVLTVSLACFVLSTTSARADTTYYVDATFPSPQAGGVITGYLIWDGLNYDGGALTATGFSSDNGDYTFSDNLILFTAFAGPNNAVIDISASPAPPEAEIFFNNGSSSTDTETLTTLSTTPPTTSVTPEPGSLLLLGTGLLGCLGAAAFARSKQPSLA